MKKCIAILLLFALSLSLFACGGSEESGKTYKIGICNYVHDASLDQIVENIKARLAEIETEKGVKFKIYDDNCNADANLLTQIIDNFLVSDVDLMIGIATPVAVAMQAATEDTDVPVVFAAVSDPVGTGLVESNEKPGANVTGTSDYLNTDAILNLLLAAKPETKKIGLLYDIGQDSSTTAIRSAKTILASKGIEVVERTGTNVDEITLAAQALIAEKVDAVFTPTDNTVMQAELSIYEAFANAGIPHFAGADSFALNGAFVGYGVDYTVLGKETANMVSDILSDGKKPAETAVRTFDNGKASINTEVLALLGFDPETLKAAFAPFCTSIEELETKESF